METLENDTGPVARSRPGKSSLSSVPQLSNPESGTIFRCHHLQSLREDGLSTWYSPCHGLFPQQTHAQHLLEGHTLSWDDQGAHQDLMIVSQ